MYRQIWLHADDQHFQSILWRASSEFPVEVYRLHTVTHGVFTSTFLAQCTLKQLVAAHGAEYPLGASIPKNDIYMDDVLS